MAITKSSIPVLPSALVTAGGTKASPSTGGNGSTIDCRAYYGGELTWKITNGASAPGVQMSVTFQSSHDGTNWYDYYTSGGDTVANSINSGSIIMDNGVMYLKALAYGNTVNSVTVEANLQAITAV